MKNKKIIISFIVLVIVIFLVGYFAIKYVKNQKQEENKIEEYTPEEEIADNQLRQTIVSLYFPSKDSKEIVIYRLNVCYLVLRLSVLEFFL